MAVAPLKLDTITAVSPSLSEVLRLCALRAGLIRAKGSDQFVLGNPKAWLGTAYHEVLAAAGQRGEAADAAAVWERVIDKHHQRAQNHPLDRRFGPPERWQGYHLIRAMALVRAAEIAREVQAATSAGGMADNSTFSSGHERWLSAAGGRIVGRPDILRGDAVIDYKTGGVFEDGEDGVVKASYIRQLQIYAYLVKEATSRWPARGVLLPMEGPPIESDLHPKDCQKTAAEALELLEKYNGAVLGSVEATELASPSPETCRWCPFQLVCPAFWAVADKSWSEQLGTAAVGGSASSAPLPIHGGSALALQLTVNEGAVPSDSADLSPLLLATHPVLSKVQFGTRVRAVGLARRLDGSIAPTVRTVIARTADIPKIVSSAAGGPSS